MKNLEENKIKIIFFDFGGVFVDSVSNKTFIFASKLSRIPPKRLKVQFFKNRYLHQIGKEKLKTMWYRIFVKEKIKPKDAKIFSKKIIESYAKFAKPRPEVFRIAKMLKKKNIRVGLISDTCEDHADINFKKCLYKIFNPLILSHQVGTKKPYDKIFKIALKKAGVRAEESVFIDDLAENIEAARKLGFTAIRFHNASQLLNRLKALKLL